MDDLLPLILVEQDAIDMHVGQKERAVLCEQQADGIVEHVKMVGLVVVDCPADADECALQYPGRL